MSFLTQRALTQIYERKTEKQSASQGLLTLKIYSICIISFRHQLSASVALAKAAMS